MAQDSSFLATQFATRFLLPFSFDANRIQAIKQALIAANWKSHGPHKNYRSDFHDKFLETCFGKEGDSNLFQYDVDLARRKPGQEFEILSRDQHWLNGELWNQDARDIELFLSSQGVALISIGLTLEGSRLNPKPDESGRFKLSEIKTFNYRLSQDSESSTCATIDKLHGQKYGRTALKVILETLLDPVRKEEFKFRTRSDAAQLMPYTVVRFPKTIRFTSLNPPPNSPPEDDLAAQASLLAQTVEAPHPLPVQEDHGAIVRIFHTDELFAISSMGAALFIADVGRPFDRQKLQSRLEKYFLCFAVALMQRIRLIEILEEAGDVARLEEIRNYKLEDRRLQELREHALAAVTRSNLLEISSRDSINRFYRLCQDAQGVPRALELVLQTVSELDASLRAEHQGDNLKYMVATQSKVEWIEIFIVSFYSAELVEMLGRQNHLNETYVAFCTVGTLLIVGATALGLVRPWDHSLPGHTHKMRVPNEVTVAIMILVVVIASYLLIGPKAKETDEVNSIVRHIDEQSKSIHDALESNTRAMKRLTDATLASQDRTQPTRHASPSASRK